MKTIAIIPARSGSKGLKDKNIELLCGKPLLSYSILAAIESGMFDTVMVSTDSQKYSEIAKSYGAEVPFLRNTDTSSDNAGSWDVVREVLAKYKQCGKEYDTVMLLQPTSPLRTSDDIVNAFKLQEEKKANAIVSVCEVDHSPLWCNTLSDSLSMQSFIQTSNIPRQQLPTYYRINGAIYLTNVSALSNRESIYDQNCFAYIMPRERSVDIDSEVDFKFAELIMNQ